MCIIDDKELKIINVVYVLCIRQKLGAQNIVKEIKQYQKSGYNMYRGWTQTDYQNML